MRTTPSLPDGVVVKVDPSRAQPELSTAIASLAASPSRRARVGHAGAEFISTTRTGDAYAKRILHAGHRALAHRPTVSLAISLADRLRRLGLNRHPVTVGATRDLAFEFFDLD